MQILILIGLLFTAAMVMEAGKLLLEKCVDSAEERELSKYERIEKPK